MSNHHEWLSLLEVSGPFLTVPVLDRVFPQGLDKRDPEVAGRLRAAREEWAESHEQGGPDAAAIHRAWIDLVLREALEFDDQVLLFVDRIPRGFEVEVAEHHERLSPDYVVINPKNKPDAGKARLLVQVWPPSQELDSVVEGKAWSASPAERMTTLCRAKGVRLGLVTNGERWMLVDAPVGETSGYASWYGSLWTQEPITLRAFIALLNASRFFATAENDTLEALLVESVAYQHEVTDRLGMQVRQAVEVLVQALDRADQDRNRTLLADVSADQLYEAALTVMMRLVFLFCAEERGLLLLGDPLYNANYAVSPLRGQLREEADRVGVQVLERRQDAWSRILATFRAVYGGIDHDILRLPALGGSLFDPDRYPFLEGRATGTSWREIAAVPLPIDNRTVLHLLESLQLLRIKGRGGITEARRLSYRALDIEQIGHVYEGLLDHVAIRVKGPTLGLSGAGGLEPEIALDELELKKAEGDDVLVDFLHEETKRSKAALRNDLHAEPDEEVRELLYVACGSDQVLLERIMPFHALIRDDVWGYPIIYRTNAFMVTTGAERRQTGTHYTPKSLTEAIVKETLEPVVYEGPAEGKPRNEWKLKSAAALLDLKICDMAMGSAAFLVQVCRWLGERVVEAWGEIEAQGKSITADGEIVDQLGERDALPKDPDERYTIARRLIAERCIYGVDINPMAVELAKLSIWLVTLAKGRPFGFLDHNLRYGDSLLGVRDIEQLSNFHLDPEKGKELHGAMFGPASYIEPALKEALDLRQRLRSHRIVDVEDIRDMARLHAEARHVLERVEIIADLLSGVAILTAGDRPKVVDQEYVRRADQVRMWLAEGRLTADEIRATARELLDTDLPDRLTPRQPFHWVIAYPEVFQRDTAGFDAIVGNPPFLGGQRITGTLGTNYRNYLVYWIAIGVRGSADLVAYFFLHAYDLLRASGNFGLLAVNTIAEGDTRQVGLERMVKGGATIYAACPNERWPGQAAVVTSRVHLHKGDWHGARILSGRPVSYISAFLSDQEDWSPKQLKANEGKSYIGSYVLGMGFTMTEAEARGFIRKNPKYAEVIFPYLNGEDLNSDPQQKASRWVINFWDWPLARDAKGEWKKANEAERVVWLGNGRVPVDYPASVAADFPELLAIVEKEVKPERDKVRDKGANKRWWLYIRPRPELYHTIGRGHSFCRHPEEWGYRTKPVERVLCITRVSKTVAFALVENNMVFSEAIVVFALDRYAHLALLQSSIHVVFAWQHASKLKHDLRYSPSDAFDTFPFPDSDQFLTASRLDRLGESYQKFRATLMRNEGIGLTRLYNRMHDPSDTAQHVLELRELHREIDHAVAAAYGWTDLDLGHAFHEVPYLPTNDRIRYTISEPARLEVLRRLALLNKQRYEQEVKAGLHAKKKVLGQP